MAGCQSDSAMLRPVCRACLTARPRAWCQLAAQQYTFCTALQIPENDSLPQTLCMKCFNLLDKFYFFKKQCIESEHTLRYSIQKDVISKEELTENAGTKDEIEIHIKTEIQNDDGNKSNSIPENGDFYGNANDDDDDAAYDDPVFSDNNDDIDDDKSLIFRNTATLVYDDILPKDIKKICKIKSKKKKNIKIKKKCDESLPKKKYIRIRCRKIIKNFPCPLCHRRFVNAEKLDAHNSKIHLKSKNFICHVCGGRYLSQSQLKSHLETHEFNERTHECNVCKRKYKTERNLRSHMFRHKEKRFICEECKFPFLDRNQLFRHMLTHKGIKPYTCQICKKSYARKSFLTIHHRSHSGERPFDCDLCSMNFTSKVRLVEHRRIHTGEKPFKCVICNHSFSQCGTMSRHMKTHIK